MTLLSKDAFLMLAALGAGLAFSMPVAAQEFIILQSTTSTRDSGLYDFLLPKFKAAHGINVRVVSVGTGQAIRNARDCNGDVLLVHSKEDEEKFVADDFGKARYDVMYNDFVVVGPANDPANISDTSNVLEALKKIASSKSSFASRGDDSGTYKAEQRLWGLAGIDALAASGDWYLETGSGMGNTLTFAVGKNSYAISDRSTWTKYANKQKHQILVQDDPPMFNQYGVVAVNETKCPNVKSKAAETFINWLLSKEGQDAIGQYRVDGKQLFFPNHKQANN